MPELLERPVDPNSRTHAFLLRAAELLHQHGTPSYRLERVMTEVSQSLNIPATFLYTPTALVVSMGSGASERTYVRRIESGSVDIGKLLAFDETLERLEDGTLSLQQAFERLEAAADASATYSAMTGFLAAGVACAAVAVIFGGSWLDTTLAGALGIAISGLTTLANRVGGDRGWLEPILGFLVASVVLASSQSLPINDRLVTLAALILALPGLALTIALTELAVGHLSSGSARLAGAAVTLFSLVLGVAIAWRIGGSWAVLPHRILPPLPYDSIWIAVACAPIAFAIVFKAPWTQWPLIFAVSTGGFLASRVGHYVAAAEGAAFAGAVMVGCCSNLYARLSNRPAMVALTPGLLILVPGSIGYQSLTAMVDEDTIRGVELAFDMLIAAVALVGGVLISNLILPPKRIL